MRKLFRKLLNTPQEQTVVIKRHGYNDKPINDSILVSRAKFIKENVK